MPNLDFHVSTKMGDMSGITKLRDVMKEIEESAKRITNTMAGFNASSSIATPTNSGGGSAHAHPGGSGSQRVAYTTPQVTSGSGRTHSGHQRQSSQPTGQKYDLNTQNGLYQWDTQVFAPIQSLLFGFNKSLGNSTPSVVTQTQKRKIDDNSLLNWFTSLNASAVKNNKEMDQLYSKVFDHYESSGNFLVKEGREFYKKYGSQLGAPSDIESVDTMQKNIPAQKLLGNSTSWQVGSVLGGFVKKNAPFLTAAGATAWGLNQLSQGYSTWKQNSSPVDALAHSLGTTVKSVEDFRQQIDFAGSKFGQTLQQSAASAALLTQSFGNLGQAGIVNLTGSAARFSYNNGLTPQQGAQITATSAQLGITSGVGSSMSADQFQNALSNAAVQAGMSGRQGQFMTGTLGVLNTIGNLNPIISNPQGIVGMMTALGATGIQGLQGLRGAQVANQYVSATMNPNALGVSVMMSAIKKATGKTPDLYDAMKLWQSGPQTKVKGTDLTLGQIETDYLNKDFSKKGASFILQAEGKANSLSTAEQLLKTKNLFSTKVSTTDTQKFWKSLYDKQQINEQTKNVEQSGAGSIFAYPSIAWNALGFGGQVVTSTIGGIFGAKALGKATKGIGGKILSRFSKVAPTAAESGGVAAAAEGTAGTAVLAEGAGAAGVATGAEVGGEAGAFLGPIGALAGLAVGGLVGWGASKLLGGNGNKSNKTATGQSKSSTSTQEGDTITWPSVIKQLTIDNLKINQLAMPKTNGDYGNNLFSSSFSSSGASPAFLSRLNGVIGTDSNNTDYKIPKNQADFIDEMYPYSVKVQNATGIPGKDLLAQWAWESGSGTSEAVKENLNFGGIKPFDQYGPGKDSEYAGFKSLNDFANADITVLNNARYAGARADAKNGASSYQVGYDLATEGYATANPSAYGSGVSSLAQQIGVEFERIVGKYMRKLGVSGPVKP